MDTKTILRILRKGEATSDFYKKLLEDIEDLIGKTDKQIALLQDSILIYHMQRAPSRRVWYVNVGNTRGDRAKEILKDFRDNYVAGLGERDPHVSEDIYLPAFADGSNTRLEYAEDMVTWDTSGLLEPFYQQRSRLLALYGRLFEATTGGARAPTDIAKIISLICEVEITLVEKPRRSAPSWSSQTDRWTRLLDD